MRNSFDNPAAIAGWEESVMITPEENKPYLTLMRGVGVFQCVLMGYNSQSEEYEISRTWPASKSAEKALGDVQKQSEKLHIEVRF